MPGKLRLTNRGILAAMLFAALLAGNASAERHPVLDQIDVPHDYYYYSNVDHELSPAWAPDGNSLFYVADPEVPYGTGAGRSGGL